MKPFRLSRTATRHITVQAPLKLNNTRPQLPFLQASARYSTNRKAEIASKLRLVGYTLLTFWAGGATIAIAHGCYKELYLDRLYPSPTEWTFQMRHSWRSAQDEIAQDRFGKKLANWAGVGDDLCRLIKAALQDPELAEGLVDQTPDIPGTNREFTSLSGLPRLGEDVSSKSEAWKQAYFEAWMAYATAAERNFDWVKDTSRRLVFAKRYMIGPSNPNPAPMPQGVEAPREEDCEPCFESPSFFYIHILTTKGFSTKQRIDAALAWSSWLEFQGDTTTASQLNAWSLELSRNAVQDPDRILSKQNNIIEPTAPFVTSNILKACTHVAAFEARHNDLSSALNMLISILRARRAAPDAALEQQHQQHPPDLSSFTKLYRFLTTAPSLPPQPSGNEPFTRTQANRCEEAAVMTYIGELLFASQSQSAGLSWTRDAVAQAESGYNDAALDPHSRLNCAQCIEAGLSNWLKMTSSLIVAQRRRNEHRSWLEKLKATFGGESAYARLVDSGDWRAEHDMVEMRRAAFVESRIMNEIEGKKGLFL